MAQGQHKQKSASQLAKIAKKAGSNRVQRAKRAAPKSQALLKERAMQKVF